MLTTLILTAHAQSIPNPSFERGPSTLPQAVPNDATTPGWQFDDADVASASLLIDCERLLEPAPEGTWFARAVTYTGIDGTQVLGRLATVVTDLTPDVPYLVRFDAAMVRHFGQSTGHWQVALGPEVDWATGHVLPSNPGQSAWVEREVGPFTPNTQMAALAFTVVSDGNGTSPSPRLPDADNGCGYGSFVDGADLLLDDVRIIGDHDLDGLYDDEEARLGTDPHDPDTDGDGLTDYQETVETLTEPTIADTDGDGLSDGDEVELGTDPDNPDSDGNGCPDGEQYGGEGCPTTPPRGLPDDAKDDGGACSTGPVSPWGGLALGLAFLLIRRTRSAPRSVEATPDVAGQPPHSRASS